VYKVVGDELFSWVIMFCDLKVLDLLFYFLLPTVVIKSCVIILSLL